MVQVLFSFVFGSGSEREGLWIWDLGLRFSGFLQGLIGFILGFRRFQGRFSGVGLATVFVFRVQARGGKLFVDILSIGSFFESGFWSRQTAASLCRSKF